MKKIIIFTLILIFIPIILLANAGLPVIIIIWPPLIISLLPIVVIESLIFGIVLKKKWIKCLKYITYANLISTLAGIPITWLILLFIEIPLLTINFVSYLPSILQIILTSPWIVPGIYTNITISYLMMLFFFFLISVYIEYKFIRSKFLDINPALLKKGITLANIISYLLICICFIIWIEVNK